MRAWHVFLAAAFLSPSIRTLPAQANTGDRLRSPELAAFGSYTRRMSAAYGPGGALSRCAFGSISLGEVDSMRLRWPHHWLTLPRGFMHGPMRLRYDSLWHPTLQRRWLGQEWLPGLLIEPVDWYRWNRPHPDARSNPQLQGTLVQLRDYRDYPIVLAEPPWKVTDAEECEWETLGEGARVMRYTLVHPEHPSQWVLTASWYGRREDGTRGFLSIGPDVASQAEALQILRRLRHEDP